MNICRASIVFVMAMPLVLFASRGFAFHTDTHFDDTTKHRIVYQLNKADEDYIEHILFSAGEMLRKYGDDIHIVITAFGPGINLLGKQPKRPISALHRQRVQSLASYGVEFQICGNTMKSLGWGAQDIIEEAKIVPVGVDGLMQLQEQGYSYVSW